MQCALPMYFPPRAALQGFWGALRGLLQADARMAGVDLPHALSEPLDYHAHWLQADVLLSQACGYPLVTLLAGKVQLVGTFAYDVPGAHGLQCRSQLICRTQDARRCLAAFAGSTLAFNDTMSQSGYNALRALVATHPDTAQRPFFGRTLQTGAHDRSIDAVRSKEADLAALDAVSWALWQRAHPALAAELRVLGQTEAYPGLPLITALQTPPDVLAALRDGLHTVATAPAFAAARAPLLIRGFGVSTLDDYQRCLQMQNQALAQGLERL